MTDAHAGTQAVADKSGESADAVTDPSMAPMDDAAGGPTAGKKRLDEPSDEEAAAKLGDFA